MKSRLKNSVDFLEAEGVTDGTFGSMIASDLLDRLDVTHRIIKAPGAIGALRKGLFGTKCACHEAKRKAYTGILPCLLFGCESWYLAADLVGTLTSGTMLGSGKCPASLCTRFVPIELPPLESRASSTTFACVSCVG